MNDILNIIHLKTNTERRQSFMEQMAEHKIKYKVWDGIIVSNIPFMGVALAHHRIVRDAQEKGLSEVYIAEDDLQLTSHNAWKYYLENKPKEFDLYLAGIYNLEGEGGNLDENNRVKDFFCGMTLYCVPQHYYSQFLSTNTMNHIDRELSKRSATDKFIVCNPFTVYQRNGWSDLKKCTVDYSKYVKQMPLYKG